LRKKLFLFIAVFMALHGAWAVVDGTTEEKQKLAQLIQQQQTLEKDAERLLDNFNTMEEGFAKLEDVEKIENQISEYRKRGITTYWEDKENAEFEDVNSGDDVHHPLYPKNKDCIHVSDIGVKVITSSAIRAECKRRNLGICDSLVEAALNLFYDKYSPERAELCLSTIHNICSLLGWDAGHCNLYRGELANSMVFSDENIDSRFLDFALPEHEAKTLIELAVKKENPTWEIYCSNRAEQPLSELFKCKLVDGENFINRSYVFSGSRFVYGKGGDNIIQEARKVREHLTRAGNSVLWPGKETVLDVQLIAEGNKANVWGLVGDVSAAECNKYNDLIKNYFGGYAKMEPVAGDDGASKDDKMVCVTQWYPSSTKRKTVNRDFDKRGFGTNYANFINRENVENAQFLIDYLKNSSEQSGKELTNIHCDNTPGVYKNVKISGFLFGKTHVLDSDKAYFWRCYGTYNGKELVEDFLFKWRRNITHIDKYKQELFIYTEEERSSE